MYIKQPTDNTVTGTLSSFLFLLQGHLSSLSTVNLLMIILLSQDPYNTNERSDKERDKVSVALCLTSTSIGLSSLFSLSLCLLAMRLPFHIMSGEESSCKDIERQLA